jgi:hypothetical protein
MVDLNRKPLVELISQGDMTHKIPLPELSATYCYSLLKAKGRETTFDPAKCLPEECFKNNSMVLPFHLMNLLRMWDLKLSSIEFQKLWQR